MMEHSRFTVILCRNMKSCRRHNRKQSDSFKRYCFTARIRTCYDKRIIFAAKHYVICHDLLFVDKRMTCFFISYDTLVVQYRLICVHIKRQSALTEHKIKLCDILIIHKNCMTVFCNKCRKFRKYSLNFLLLFRMQITDFVVVVYNAHRLDKQRCTARGRIVYNTVYFTSVFTLYRYNVSVRTHCYNRVLQKLFVMR